MKSLRPEQRERLESLHPSADGSYNLTGDTFRALLADSDALAACERERDEAQRAKYGTPCKCESWIAACGKAEDERDALRAQVATLREQVAGLVAEREQVFGLLAKAEALKPAPHIIVSAAPTATAPESEVQP